MIEKRPSTKNWASRGTSACYNFLGTMGEYWSKQVVEPRQTKEEKHYRTFFLKKKRSNSTEIPPTQLLRPKDQLH